MHPHLWMIAVCVIAAPATAQVAQHQPAPVDQAVGDLDPLATSFRRLDPGLAQFDAATALRPVLSGDWLHVNGVPMDPLTGLPMPQSYVYAAPGFRAYLPQAEYVVRSRDEPGQLDRNVSPANDGEYLLAPPANMVYDLIPRPPRYRPAAPNPAAVDRRLDTRIDARLPAVPTHVSGGATGNVDYLGGARNRSPHELLVELYGGDDRHLIRPGDRPARPAAARPESAAQQQVVDQPDAPEAGRDERDDAAGE